MFHSAWTKIAHFLWEVQPSPPSPQCCFNCTLSHLYNLVSRFEAAEWLDTCGSCLTDAAIQKLPKSSFASRKFDPGDFAFPNLFAWENEIKARAILLGKKTVAGYWKPANNLNVCVLCVLWTYTHACIRQWLIRLHKLAWIKTVVWRKRLSFQNSSLKLKPLECAHRE